ncbi:MAG TPA: hypothetical protein VKR06_30430 [Ktedonosporobacter sp.]|nr:hypothetical protein [Ktedonosporobacter sp.]
MVTALLHVRREHHLTSAQLADAAGVPLRIVYLGEIGGLIDAEDASKILKALSRLTGKLYTPATVELNIKVRISDEPALSQPPANYPIRSKRLTHYR